jgi:DNA polymerase-1
MGKVWAVDTETTGLNRFKGAVPFLYLAYDGETYIVSKDKEDLRPIIEDESNICVFHNAKFDLHMLRAVGLNVKATVYDTLLAKGLLKGGSKNKGLKKLAKSVLNEETNEEEQIKQWFRENKIKKEDQRYDLLPDDLLSEYGKKDVYFTYELWKIFEKELKDEELFNLFEQECKLQRVLVDMEERGVLIDKEKTDKLNDNLKESIEKVKCEIAEKFGDDFEFTSNKQLGEKLVSLGIEVQYTDKGNISVNAKALKGYDSELCKLVFEYRKLEKLQNTYCEGFLNLLTKENTLHPNFMSWGTVTGRFSCAEPNLQNIPRPDEDRPETQWIRELFITRPGYTNFYIDYEQIEYRIAANYFNDKDLINRINAGEDVHTIQAQRIFETEYVSKENRSLAKCVNFAVLYGAGVNALADIIGKTYDKAKELYDKFHKENKVIYDIKAKIEKRINGYYYQYGRKILSPQNKTGYVHNMFGRKYWLESNETYKGFNYLCQGTAADLIKTAMIDIHDYLKDKKSNLLLNVHDELCIEVAEGEEYVVAKIIYHMENFTHMFNVDIKVDANYSTTSWAEKELYERNAV